MAHPGGRPTDYNEEMVRKTYEYIDKCEDTVEVVGSGKSIATIKKVNFPSIEGLGLYLDITRPTLSRWREDHEEFASAIEKLLQKQAKVLQENGLAGNYNNTIAKLILSHNHGFKERSETEVKGELTISKLLNEIDAEGKDESEK